MSSSTVLKLKDELRTTGDLMDLMDVIKQAASAQFQTLSGKRRKGGPQDGAQRVTAFAEAALALIPAPRRAHPFLNPETPLVLGAEAPLLGLLLVTSDDGFVGGLNASIIQKGILLPGGERANLTIVGERGKRYLTDLKKPFTYFPRFAPDDEQPLGELKDHITGLYLQGKVSRVVIVYPRLISFTNQDIQSFQLLPYEPPPAGRAGPVKPSLMEAILEPSADRIIDYLIGMLIAQKIKEVLWQSRLSELAARTMYLEGSVQTLSAQKKNLRHRYFRAKHEMTDTSIRETYAGLLMAE